MSTTLSQIAFKIIKEQELVVGPLAWSEAGKVQGLHILDQQRGELDLNGDPTETVNRLVSQYDRLFGDASHEVSKDAVASLLADLPSSEVPASLR
jgi:hypothetical protein